MRRILFSLVVLSLLLPVAAGRAQEASKPQAIIDKAIEALGGLENLEKAETRTWSQEGTYYGAGDGVPFTATFASAPPKKYRMEIPGVFTSVLNDDQGWVNAGGATQAMDAEQLKENQEQQYLSWISSLVPLGKIKDQYKLTSIEGVEVEGRPTVGVQVQSEGHRDVKLFFDKETHQLVKAQHIVKSAEQGFQEVEQAQIIKAYQDVDGAKLPSEVLVLRDGEKYVEAKLAEIKPVQELPEDTFAEP